MILPEHGIYTSGYIIESVAVAVGIRVNEGAAIIVTIARGALGAYDGGGEGKIQVGGGGFVQCTAGGGMKGVLVECGLVDTFYDVDFAAAGPVRSHCPPGGPQRTTMGHRPGIHYEQPFVIGLLALDPDAVPLLTVV